MVIAKKTPVAADAAKSATTPLAKVAAAVAAPDAVAPKTKPAAKPAAKLPARPAPATPAAPAPAEVAKVKKPKLVRDGFTIPKAEYQVLDELKLRAADLKHPTKKSELLRAGIKALAAMADSAFVAALKAVPAVKTGRPAKD